MCFGSSPEAVTPAPAPDAPEPAPVAQDVGSARKTEEAATFGSSTPTMRADRTVSSALSGGSGLQM